LILPCFGRLKFFNFFVPYCGEAFSAFEFGFDFRKFCDWGFGVVQIIWLLKQPADFFQKRLDFGTHENMSGICVEKYFLVNCVVQSERRSNIPIEVIIRKLALASSPQ
jgi:hypothetical protein